MRQAVLRDAERNQELLEQDFARGGNVAVSGRRRTPLGDTLVSNITPYFKKIWLADRGGTCSGDVIVFRAKDPRYAAFLYSVLRSDSFFEHIMAGAKGAKMPRGDKKQMMQCLATLECDQGTLDALAAIVGQIGANNRENETSSSLRNALLPKLLSGEIDVSQVEI